MKKVRLKKSKFQGKTNHLPPINRKPKEEKNEDTNNIIDRLIANELQSSENNVNIEN